MPISQKKGSFQDVVKYSPIQEANMAVNIFSAEIPFAYMGHVPSATSVAYILSRT